MALKPIPVPPPEWSRGHDLPPTTQSAPIEPPPEFPREPSSPLKEKNYVPAHVVARHDWDCQMHTLDDKIFRVRATWNDPNSEKPSDGKLYEAIRAALKKNNEVDIIDFGDRTYERFEMGNLLIGNNKGEYYQFRFHANYRPDSHKKVGVLIMGTVNESNKAGNIFDNPIGIGFCKINFINYVMEGHYVDSPTSH